MNKKQNRILVVLVILAVLSVVFGTRENQVTFTSDLEAGTGECGYIGNMGTSHRNGGVTPADCTTPAVIAESDTRAHDVYTPAVLAHVAGRDGMKTRYIVHPVANNGSVSSDPDTTESAMEESCNTVCQKVHSGGYVAPPTSDGRGDKGQSETVVCPEDVQNRQVK